MPQTPAARLLEFEATIHAALVGYREIVRDLAALAPSAPELTESAVDVCADLEELLHRARFWRLRADAVIAAAPRYERIPTPADEAPDGTLGVRVLARAEDFQ